MNHRSSMNDVHTYIPTYIPMHENYLYKSNASYVSVSHVCTTHMQASSLRDRVAQQGSKHTGTGHTHTALHGHTTDMQLVLLLHISCLVCTSCAGSPVLQCAIAIRLRGDVLCMQYWICPSYLTVHQ